MLRGVEFVNEEVPDLAPPRRGSNQIILALGNRASTSTTVLKKEDTDYVPAIQVPYQFSHHS